MATTPTTLYKALAAAQAGFHSAIKDTANPFFKSKYADLASVWEACKDAIHEQSLFVSQQPQFIEAAGCWAIVTKVYNEAGECIEGTTPIIPGKANDPQSFGSAMTYSRRYGLAATLGIVTDDDDAEGAMNRVQSAKNIPTKQEPMIPVEMTAEQKAKIIELMNHDLVTPDEEAKISAALPSLNYVKAAGTLVKLMATIKERESQAA